MRISSASSSFLLALSLSVRPAHGADRLIHSVLGDTVVAFDLPDSTPLTLLAGPIAVKSAACSADGYFFFVSRDDKNMEHVLRRWDRDGGSHAMVRLPHPTFDPTAMAFGRDGDLYINTGFPFSSEGVYRLRGADPTLVPDLLIPPFARWQFAAEVIGGGPHADALLLADVEGAGVMISEPPGTPLRLFIPSTEFPRLAAVFGIVSDPCGNILVGYELGNDSTIARFDPEGRFLENYLVAPSVPTGYWMEFDSAGNLYSSHASGPILKIAPDRSVTEFYPRGSFSSTGPFTICQDPLQCLAGGTHTVECTGERACISLAAAPQRPCMDFTWSSDCPGADFGGTERSATPTLCLDAAACNLRCNVELTLREGLRSATCGSEVIVQDTKPPEVSMGDGDLSCLWPPNHRMACFDRSDFAPAIGENCSQPVSWRFAGCASDQPDDGTGDGHTGADCVVASDGRSFCARAERAGGGPSARNGRRYRVDVVAADACGNESPPTAIGYIHVPHDQSDSAPGCRQP